MNTSAKIKDNLINSIRHTNDLSFLQAIQTIFNTSEKNLFKLSEHQKQSIEISRKQIKNGEFKDSETVLSEIRQWLKSE